MNNVTNELINMDNFVFGNVKLAKKYNAIKNFLASKKNTVIENGCINFLIIDVSYHREQIKGTLSTEDNIVIKDNMGYTWEAKDHRQIKIDRKYNSLEYTYHYYL